MVTASSNQPGWGAQKSNGSSGNVKEPITPPTQISGGIGTDRPGAIDKPGEGGARIQARSGISSFQSGGRIDKPGEAEAKAASVGIMLTQPGGSVGTGGSEAFKQSAQAPGSITQAQIDSARSYPLSRLISSSTRTKCPLHNGNNPTSLQINHDKNFWYCHACGKHGDSIAYIMELDKVDFKTAVLRLQGE